MKLSEELNDYPEARERRPMWPLLLVSAFIWTVSILIFLAVSGCESAALALWKADQNAAYKRVSSE